MQRSILSKYKISFGDKVNIFKTLKYSTFHNDLEQIEKYSGAENEVELNDVGIKSKTNFKNFSYGLIILIIGFSLYVYFNKNGGFKSETKQYGYEENGVAAVITIGDKNLCNMITVAGDLKSISDGTYSIQGNKIIFNWENLGPSEAEISNENGQDNLIVNGEEGVAIYKKIEK